jgi:pyridoxal phosphate enzyme (YggS family)
MTESAKRIAENLARVKERIAASAERSGRRPEQVKLVAVTKYIDANATRELIEAGCRDLGESRPQELWQKAEVLDDLNVHWHMIGHLQRNKVRRSVPLISVLHAGDSLRLLQTVNDAPAEVERRLPVLLEVNISGDQSKHGFSREELKTSFVQLAGLKNIEVRGLMCMAGLATNADGTRREFAELRELRDRLQENCPDNISLAELSMGMSRDYEVAIEEGATMVRVGSALYSK